MKKYVFDDSTIHTLNLYSKKLYEVFSSADRQLVESNYEWNHSNEIDMSVNPYKYYSFRTGSVQLFIHKFKNERYSLECYGFTPEGLKPYDENKHFEGKFELYRRLYGNFATFDMALQSFYDVVSQLVQYKDNPLFTDDI